MQANAQTAECRGQCELSDVKFTQKGGGGCGGSSSELQFFEWKGLDVRDQRRMAKLTEKLQ